MNPGQTCLAFAMERMMKLQDVLISGLLMGEIVRNAKQGSGALGKAAGLTLQGHIVSREQFGAWVERKKQGIAPANAGEAGLAVSGNTLVSTRESGSPIAGRAFRAWGSLEMVGA